ncbi:MULTISPECIES: hypothetical protein [unclassified Pyramidobacter]|uniref:hypothetical protein n=1 Tax=unclassified Pyramidobacter TaxID=2632171 RepID=UPI000EA06C1F|nr:hypothetical protein [Pyramidobacter sp. CG50-2]RKJ78894.1 hypothetical protein D7D26_05840 [Pyramidobacter sp. CG50-2]
MSTLPHGRDAGDAALRWFVGVPLGTNPLILLDFITLLAIAWVVSWGALVATQFVLGGYVDVSHYKGAAVVASYLSLIFIGFYGVICFIITRNRYAALYRCDRAAILCENMRCAPRALERQLLRFAPYPIEPVRAPIRSVERRALWKDVTKVRKIDDLRVIVLKGKRGTLMRVYCPDGKIYAEALAFVAERTGIAAA